MTTSIGSPLSFAKPSQNNCIYKDHTSDTKPINIQLMKHHIYNLCCHWPDLDWNIHIFERQFAFFDTVPLSCFHSMSIISPLCYPNFGFKYQHFLSLSLSLTLQAPRRYADATAVRQADVFELMVKLLPAVVVTWNITEELASSMKPCRLLNLCHNGLIVVVPWFFLWLHQFVSTYLLEN